MYRKTCHRCFRPSYSSGKAGRWACPTCGENLDKNKAEDAQNKSGQRRLAESPTKLIKRYSNKPDDDPTFMTST